ncbi:phosphotransferase family protein [Kutzneria sp. CA-103260]|uniref:phosphotransferase family protein n=1 Tax=Kutzneria sp. CA-103260 TaxID=2802641 RepID=UPI001BA97DDA|nr:phosphotransferase [Kutzneria sp. CA-103260]QUQ66682.1 Phosphotransferase enzyme family protein [Kutzneria sp. CA-103260]
MNEIARTIAEAALGRDPGPLTRAKSLSHRVFVGADVVVKIIHADRHSRLNREIALAPMLPAGIAAPLLASGEYEDLRYACYTRVPGAAPGLHLPNTDAATARKLAEQAVERLERLHTWRPESTRTLTEELDHGGFTGREAFQQEIERLEQADRDGVVPAQIIKGLKEIADRAPDRVEAAVPVHADCHWANWLANGDTVTALLDFEWARLAEPAEDWFFLIRFSGPHMAAVLDVVTEQTAVPEDELRAACEVRDANYVTSDVRLTLEGDPNAGVGSIAGLAELIDGRYWWSGRSSRA